MEECVWPGTGLELQCLSKAQALILPPECWPGLPGKQSKWIEAEHRKGLVMKHW